jgi:hypothetical protein
MLVNMKMIGAGTVYGKQNKHIMVAACAVW